MQSNQSIEDNYELGTLGVQNYSGGEPHVQRQPVQIIISPSYNTAEDEDRNHSGDKTPDNSNDRQTPSADDDTGDTNQFTANTYHPDTIDYNSIPHSDKRKNFNIHAEQRATQEVAIPHKINIQYVDEGTDDEGMNTLATEPSPFDESEH